MPLVDVLDDTFVRADPLTVREQTGDLWQAWLPALRLVVTEDRATRGTRWAADVADPATSGSAEVWLEAVPGGTVVHLYVRLSAQTAVPRVRRRARRLQDRVRRTWKRELHRWKDRHEDGRQRDHPWEQDQPHGRHGQEHPT